MNWPVEGLAEYEAELAEERQAARKDELFRRWMSFLYAKSHVEQRRETPIPYDRFQKIGNRLKLFTGYPVDDDLVGQPRLIELSEHGHRVVAGEVDSVGTTSSSSGRRTT